MYAITNIGDPRSRDRNLGKNKKPNKNGHFCVKSLSIRL